MVSACGVTATSMCDLGIVVISLTELKKRFLGMTEFDGLVQNRSIDL